MLLLKLKLFYNIKLFYYYYLPVTYEYKFLTKSLILSVVLYKKVSGTQI
nr:MAG TPA: hypothetical protein [Caudoviricetes sp.]